jgi:hypothetical protein
MSVSGRRVLLEFAEPVAKSWLETTVAHGLLLWRSRGLSTESLLESAE